MEQLKEVEIVNRPVTVPPPKYIALFRCGEQWNVTTNNRGGENDTEKELRNRVSCWSENEPDTIRIFEVPEDA